jgi:DNA repair exonuclease SbcCD ATPase subunit
MEQQYIYGIIVVLVIVIVVFMGSQNKSLEAQLVDLRDNLSKEQKTAVELNENIRVLLAEKAELQKKYDDQGVALGTLQGDKDVLQKKYDDQGVAMSALQKKYDDQGVAMSAIQKKHTDAVNVADDLIDKYKLPGIGYIVWKSVPRSLIEKIEYLGGRLKVTLDKMKDLEHRIDKLSETHALEIISKNEQIKKLDAQIVELTSKNTSLNVANTKMKSDMDALAATLMKIRVDLDKSRVENNLNSFTLDVLRKKWAALTAYLEQTAVLLGLAKFNIDNHGVINDAINALKNTTGARIKQLEEENAKLKNPVVSGKTKK